MKRMCVSKQDFHKVWIEDNHIHILKSYYVQPYNDPEMVYATSDWENGRYEGQRLYYMLDDKNGIWSLPQEIVDTHFLKVED